MTICRLRHAIDDAVGVGAGKAMIETGAKDEYRLTIIADDLNRHVVVAPCFSDLVQLSIISTQLALELNEMMPSEIEKKSRRNQKEIKPRLPPKT